MFHQKSIKITVICLLITTIVFGVVVGISYVPRRVQRVLSAVELLDIGDDEFEFLRTLDIRVDGRIRHGMFATQPHFRGLIEVDGYLFTYGNELEILFDENFFGGLLYVFAELPDLWSTYFGSRPRVETLGWIKTDRHFSSVTIWVHEWMPHNDGGSFGVNTDRIIVAPVMNLNTAIESF